MTGHSKVHHGVPADSLTRLKPQKLGRHYHKIPHYIKEITHKHPRIISDYFLRHYRINLDLHNVEVSEQREQPPECVYRSPLGKVGFAIDRGLLSEALECYYGGTSLPGQDLAPISTSEQRLRNRLGVELTHLFARSLLAGDTFGPLDSHDDAYEPPQWEYIAEFAYSSHRSGALASIFLYLDHQLVDELTRRISGPPPPALSVNPIDNIKQLPVRLDCVLAIARLPLGQVLQLAVGDILVLRLLERVDVRINQERLFHGAIFESDGRLSLTSLQSAKKP